VNIGQSRASTREFIGKSPRLPAVRGKAIIARVIDEYHHQMATHGNPSSSSVGVALGVSEKVINRCRKDPQLRVIWTHEHRNPGRPRTVTPEQDKATVLNASNELKAANIYPSVRNLTKAIRTSVGVIGNQRVEKIRNELIDAGQWPHEMPERYAKRSEQMQEAKAAKPPKTKRARLSLIKRTWKTIHPPKVTYCKTMEEWRERAGYLINGVPKTERKAS
jgi:hypothetical protein